MVDTVDTDGSGVRFDLGQDLYLDMDPETGEAGLAAVRAVEVTTTEDGQKERVRYLEDKDIEWFRSKQKVDELSAAISDQVSISKEYIRGQVREIAIFIDEQGKDWKMELMSQKLREGVEATEEVQIYSGEDSEVYVYINGNGRSGQLSFSGNDWNDVSPKALENQWFDAFAEIIHVSDDIWTTVRDQWQDEAVVRDDDRLTGSGIIADKLIEAFRERLKLYFEPADAGDDKWGAVWVDSDDNEHDEPVLHVPSTVVGDLLDSLGYRYDQLNDVAPILDARGIKLGSTSTGRFGSSPQKYWTLSAEELGRSKSHVHSGDDEPKGGVAV